MNTNFRILWFEDNDEWYSAEEEQLRDYIEMLCFKPIFKRFNSIPNDEIIEIEDIASYDLVLADLNLSEGKQGDEAIKFLRNNNILADVLFYSTDGVDKIREIMKSETLEGVYLVNRDEMFFDSKAQALINKVTKRAEDIVNVRGMLMDNVSTFDEKLKDAIKKTLSILSEQKRKALDEYAFEKVKNQISLNNQKTDEFRESFILKALDNSFLIDSNKLSMIVNKIFKEHFSHYAKMVNFHENYSNLILQERNRLAHAKKEPESNGIFYFQDKDGSRIEYTSDKCREIRKNINHYNELLDEIFDVIQ